MTALTSTREAVARAIYAKAGPGRRWEDLPTGVLEYWGGLADAAIAAMPPPLSHTAAPNPPRRST